ncbi:Peptidoglycan-binding LysM [Geotalea uraniireducens Rf4]|uniref:Peptidoglycan-binding LysM n=2 Tax=Geotalea uraniireducens TaxID=351604 RepID=A5G3L4_GEOUR|nr:Peptidoglycan-binding LysM [Geotalea uraniireducens Rf4]
MIRLCGKLPLLVILIVLLLSGCTTPAPMWRQEAQNVLDKARRDEGDKIFPAEFASIEELILKGEVLVKEEEIEDADKLFLLAWSKGSLLEKKLAAEKLRLKEEAQRRADAERLELERKRALEAEARRIALEKYEAAKAAQEAEARRIAEKNAEKARQPKERQLPAYHTVKRGESLPFIASQPEVYNDRNLWPLLYRANRDQISDPKHIWPGQVLRIPRNLSREDIVEARRYAQEKPLH